MLLPFGMAYLTEDRAAVRPAAGGTSGFSGRAMERQGAAEPLVHPITRQSAVSFFLYYIEKEQILCYNYITIDLGGNHEVSELWKN